MQTASHVESPAPKKSAYGAGRSRVRIGIDIGGTFTDFVVQDVSTGMLLGLKIPTTPEDPSKAVFEGLGEFQKTHGLTPAETMVVVHATTLATNTILEAKGAKVGLITTAGFRDILEMRRETRYDDYDLQLEFPPPLVPRSLRHEVRERVQADGTIRVPLNEDDAVAVIEALRREDVQALAVCFLHAYSNPVHENRMGALVTELLPGIPVSLSSSVQPEIREFERFSTTVANAYVQPALRRYIDRIIGGLKRQGYRSPLYIMQSNGGFAGPDQSAERPVRLIESGPAAGVLAAGEYGRASGECNVISFDMGGTTAKISILRDCKPRLATELEVARVHRFKKGSGYPLKCPSIELIEIGAGGGSIAEVDAVGRVRVGPQSAGSAPGPVCYGRGGEFPTVTDADLVLGYLDPSSFSGNMTLDRDSAEAAIHKHVAKAGGMTSVRAAWGIHEIVNENMATAARLHLLERGEDPRQFTLIAFGGAGPIHAHQVAAKLGIRRLLFPLDAGLASAYGLMAAPISTDIVRTFLSQLDALDWEHLNKTYDEMVRSARTAIPKSFVQDLEFQRLADMRYRGQGFEIQVTMPEGPYGPETRARLSQAFADEYGGIFGRQVSEVPIEMVNLRLLARGPKPKSSLCTGRTRGAGGDPLKVRRQVFFGDLGDFVTCPVFDRTRLDVGFELEGPAIVEEPSTSVVIGPGQVCRVDKVLNLLVTLPGEELSDHEQNKL